MEEQVDTAALEIEEDNNRFLDVELEALQSIYINETNIQKDEQYTIVSIDLHPATADNLDEQYVKMTLKLILRDGYPEVVPDINIRNPRGLSDEKLTSITQDLIKVAQSKKGNSMLFEIIEAAKDHLTAGNRPCEECAICLHGFHGDDVFTKTECYHYFHSHCLSRYSEYFYSSKEDTKSEDTSEKAELLCPVCRLTIQFNELNEEFPPPIKGDDQFVVTDAILDVQKKMKELYLQQVEKGGIIDLEAEKNKYLLEIADIPSVCDSTSETRLEDSESDSNVIKAGETEKAISPVSDEKQISQVSSENVYNESFKSDQRHTRYNNGRTRFGNHRGRLGGNRKYDRGSYNNYGNYRNDKYDNQRNNVQYGSYTRDFRYDNRRNNRGYNNGRRFNRGYDGGRRNERYNDEGRKYREGSNKQNNGDSDKIGDFNLDKEQDKYKDDTFYEKEKDQLKDRKTDRPYIKRNDMQKDMLDNRGDDIFDDKKEDILDDKRNDMHNRRDGSSLDVTLEGKSNDMPDNRKNDGTDAKMNERFEGRKNNRSNKPDDRSNKPDDRSNKPDDRSNRPDDRSSVPGTRRNDRMDDRKNNRIDKFEDRRNNRYDDTRYDRRNDRYNDRRDDRYDKRNGRFDDRRNDRFDDKRNDRYDDRRNNGSFNNKNNRPNDRHFRQNSSEKYLQDDDKMNSQFHDSRNVRDTGFRKDKPFGYEKRNYRFDNEKRGNRYGKTDRREENVNNEDSERFESVSNDRKVNECSSISLEVEQQEQGTCVGNDSIINEESDKKMYVSDQTEDTESYNSYHKNKFSRKNSGGYRTEDQNYNRRNYRHTPNYSDGKKFNTPKYSNYHSQARHSRSQHPGNESQNTDDIDGSNISSCATSREEATIVSEPILPSPWEMNSDVSVNKSDDIEVTDHYTIKKNSRINSSYNERGPPGTGANSFRRDSEETDKHESKFHHGSRNFRESDSSTGYSRARNGQSDSFKYNPRTSKDNPNKYPSKMQVGDNYQDSFEDEGNNSSEYKQKSTVDKCSPVEESSNQTSTERPKVSDVENVVPTSNFLPPMSSSVAPPPGFQNPSRKIVYGLAAANPPPGFNRS